MLMNEQRECMFLLFSKYILQFKFNIELSLNQKLLDFLHI